jgi:hypothetical protein
MTNMRNTLQAFEETPLHLSSPTNHQSILRISFNAVEGNPFFRCHALTLGTSVSSHLGHAATLLSL